MQLPPDRIRRFRKRLLFWFARHRRDLPWRRSADPWAILVSEFMLQQTRVEAVIDHFRRFMATYPDPARFARETGEGVLKSWVGLGYYSRARNLHQAARQIVESGSFPSTYANIRALPGVGSYTAAAVASIAFGLPQAALDGNVARVLARIFNIVSDVKSSKTRAELQILADQLLDPRYPGDFNQALMELGAMVCTPKSPRCAACPVSRDCQAFELGRQRELPVRLGKTPKLEVAVTLLLIRNEGQLLFRQRPHDAPRLAGFWELPELSELPSVTLHGTLCRFRHTIVNHSYIYTVASAGIQQVPSGYRWYKFQPLDEIPLSTAARKAITCSLKKGKLG